MRKKYEMMRKHGIMRKKYWSTKKAPNDEKEISNDEEGTEWWERIIKLWRKQGMMRRGREREKRRGMINNKGGLMEGKGE